MKRVIFAAVAAMFVLASMQVAADDKPESTTTSTQTTSTSSTVPTMSEEDCKAAMAKCMDDNCKAELMAKGCQMGNQ